jgi:hypothetical protein
MKEKDFLPPGTFELLFYSEHLPTSVLLRKLNANVGSKQALCSTLCEEAQSI